MHFQPKSREVVVNQLHPLLQVLSCAKWEGAVINIEALQYLICGVVHAYVGQKLLKPYILRVFWLTDYELFHATFD